MYSTTPEQAARTYLIAEMPDHERPRERLTAKGADALSDAELLAILLRTGSRGRSALDLARDLMLRFGGRLERLAMATEAELRQVRGVGQAKATEINAAFALARRLCRVRTRESPRIETPGDVADLLRETFRNREQEELHVLLLDAKHHLRRTECVTVGLVDRSQIHAREAFRSAIRENCSRIVLAHNHPSGDATPSPQDIACTRSLVEAGKIVGIEVLDHVVIGRPTETRLTDYVSFREAGLI